MDHSDQELLDLLKQDEDLAIELIFQRYYTYLCRVVYKVVPDAGLAEDLAQEVFFDLWRKRAQLRIESSLPAYLRRAVLNRTLNHLRDQKIRFSDPDAAPPPLSRIAGAGQQLEQEELQELIDRAIDALPDRCRAVFMLSRFEELSYQEIADHLGISVKTVENQISKALKYLRQALKPYLNACWLTFFWFFG